MSGPMSSIDDRVREIFEFVKLRSVDGVKPASMLGEIGQEAPLLKVNGSLDAAKSIWNSASRALICGSSRAARLGG
jgi:hypothetical protein